MQNTTHTHTTRFFVYYYYYCYYIFIFPIEFGKGYNSVPPLVVQNFVVKVYNISAKSLVIVVLVVDGWMNGIHLQCKIKI